MATATNETNKTNKTSRESRETGRRRESVVMAARGIARRIPRAHRPSARTIAIPRAQSQPAIGSLTTSTNIAIAGLQLVIGYQWLVSGIDKILLGTFPTQLGQLLTVQIGSGKLPGLFAELLKSVVTPNAGFFGYAVMLGETFAGLGLIVAGLFTLLRPVFEARTSGRLWFNFAMTDRIVAALAPYAAGGAGLLGLSYYLLDGAPTLWFQPSLAYGGAVSPGMVLALASLVLLAAQVFAIRTGR